MTITKTTEYTLLAINFTESHMELLIPSMEIIISLSNIGFVLNVGNNLIWNLKKY